MINKKTKIIALMVVVLVIVIYLIVKPSGPGLTTTLPPNVSAVVNQSAYELPRKYLPGGINYEINYTFTLGSNWIPSGPGVIYTGLTFYKNITAVNRVDTPMQVYSVVKLCNS